MSTKILGVVIIECHGLPAGVIRAPIPNLILDRLELLPSIRQESIARILREHVWERIGLLILRVGSVGILAHLKVDFEIFLTPYPFFVVLGHL